MELITHDAAGENPSIARRLCAELVAFAWADHWIVAFSAAGKGLQNHGDSISIKRRNASTRRFTLALKTLAQIEAAERRTALKAPPVVDPNENVFVTLQRQMMARMK